MNNDADQFDQVVEQVEQFVNGDYHRIKYGDQEVRLFKSLANRRLEELGETFDEYTVRLLINRKMVKLHKKGRHERTN